MVTSVKCPDGTTSTDSTRTSLLYSKHPSSPYLVSSSQHFLLSWCIFLQLTLGLGKTFILRKHLQPLRWRLLCTQDSRQNQQNILAILLIIVDTTPIILASEDSAESSGVCSQLLATNSVSNVTDSFVFELIGLALLCYSEEVQGLHSLVLQLVGVRDKYPTHMTTRPALPQASDIDGWEGGHHSLLMPLQDMRSEECSLMLTALWITYPHLC